MKRIFSIFIFIVLISQQVVLGQDDNYFEQKLLPDDMPVFSGFFGNIISSSENEVIIYGDRQLFCYQYIGDQWINNQVITEPEESINFGYDFCINDSLLVVGAPSNMYIYPDNYQGGIYLFQKDGGSWYFDTFLIPDGPVLQFGGSVYLREDFLIITAFYGDIGNYESVVYLYRYDGNTWIEESTIFSPDNSDGFGSGILTIDNNKLILGDTVFNHKTGVVYIYEKIDDNWNLGETISPSEPTENSRFGSSIFYTNNFLFIGAPGDVYSTDWSGQVYVFQYDGDTWIETQILTASDAGAGDKFGSEIHGSGNKIVIGAYNNDDAGGSSGSAYIFENTNGEWVEMKKIIPFDSENVDLFGGAVSMNEDFVFIAAPDKNGFQGAVYVYDPHDTTLHANFAGDVRNGNAPVTVQFTAVPQGNPTAYEWDFNSDGFVDSTEPNPEFTYQINGTYTVTLTVYDETGSDSEVKEDYIQVVSDILFGDVNGDGFLDVSDLVMYIDFVLGYSEPEEEQFLAGDVNYSGQIDIIDIVMVIDEILA